MSFSQQIARFNKSTQNKIQRVRRGVTFELMRAVILDTPVLTGRLRNNWMVSEGEPDLSTTEALDPNGTAKLSEVKTFVDKTSGDVALYLSNSLPYAPPIEFEGWSHTKAPEGMVRRNISRFNQIVTIQTSEAKKTK